MYTAIHLANYVVSKCVADGHPISNLQLQKILYFIQKDYLDRGLVAFPDEIEAWQFGPVVPNVYYHFCGFGSMPITIRREAKINYEDAIRIDPIIESKRALQPWDLVEETHHSGGAWEIVYDNGNGNHKVIKPELIRSKG